MQKEIIKKTSSGKSCYTEYNETSCFNCGEEECFGSYSPTFSKEPSTPTPEIDKRTYKVLEGHEQLYEEITGMLTEYAFDNGMKEDEVYRIADNCKYS